MSVLNKIPFINNVLAHLSDEELKTLLNLMNGLGNRTELNRILGIPSGNRTNISVADKGVHMCSLQIGPSLSHGYLLYSDFACVLLSFTDFQRISMFDINVSKNNYEIIEEYLDINELRSQVNDLLTEAGELGDIVAKIEVTDITAMTKDQLDKLEPGDVVNKITGNAVHSYHVSYKGTGAGTGICLTYSAAGYLETVSYDRSGNNWVYNSTDVCDISSSGGVARLPFKSDWPTTGTTKAFCDAVNADSDAVVGMMFLGDASFSDLPFNGNGDVVVEIMDGPNAKKTVHLILTSGTTAPYRWEYTYWNDGTDLSGWIGFQPELKISSVADGTVTKVIGFDSDGAVKKSDLVNDTNDIMLNFAPAYSSESTYDVGEIVSYNKKVYECSTTISSAEAFNSAHWTETDVSSLIIGAINTRY